MNGFWSLGPSSFILGFHMSPVSLEIYTAWLGSNLIFFSVFFDSFLYSYDRNLDEVDPISPDVCLHPQTQSHHGEILDRVEQTGLALDVLAAAGAGGHPPQQVVFPQSQAECRGAPT